MARRLSLSYPWLLLWIAGVQDASRPGRAPGSLEKGMLGPGKASVMGSRSQWGSRELVEKVGGDLASGLSCACL